MAAPTYLERFSLSLVHDQPGTFSSSLSIAFFRRPPQWPSRMPLSSSAPQGHHTASPSGVCFLATYHPLDRRAEGSAGDSVLLSSKLQVSLLLLPNQI